MVLTFSWVFFILSLTVSSFSVTVSIFPSSSSIMMFCFLSSCTKAEVGTPRTSEGEKKAGRACR